ncbi:MAG: M48 family metalloprotease [Geodermatophilaceae bacterium]
MDIAGSGRVVLTGPLLLLGPAERAVVRAFCRFRTPTSTEIEWLTPLRIWTERRWAAGPSRFDWYVSDDPEPAALAAGRRSIAVSSGFLQLVGRGGLTEGKAMAVLLHEAGHHVTGGRRYGLVVCWLTWPWRSIYRCSMRLGQLLPGARSAMVLLPVVFGIAFVNVAGQDAPPEQVVAVLVLLVVLALAVFPHPLADAAVSRAGEHAADRYASQLGAGADLAAALQVLNGCDRVSLSGRLRAGHPTMQARLHRLYGPSATVST